MKKIKLIHGKYEIQIFEYDMRDNREFRWIDLHQKNAQPTFRCNKKRNQKQININKVEKISPGTFSD